MSKRRRVKGIVSQIEGLYVFHNKADSIPIKRHKHYEGGTRGDVIAKVLVDTLERCWRLPAAVKVEMLGREEIKPCGGKVDFEDGDVEEEDQEETAPGDGKETAGPDDLVPFAWMSHSLRFFENLLHMLPTDGVIDFTPGDGNLALACIATSTAYLGFCHTEPHVTGLYEHLTTKVLELMAHEPSKLYNVGFVKAMAKGVKRPAPAPAPVDDAQTVDSDDVPEGGKKQPKKPKKAEGKKAKKAKGEKGKKKKKATKGKKKDDDESDDAGSSSAPSPSQSDDDQKD